MADNTGFFQDEEQKAQDEIEKIKLGDAEYDPKELEAMVEKGKKVDEYQKKYNTDFDKAWSSYGKTTTENKKLREELEEIKAQQQVKPQPTSDELTDEQKESARKVIQDILGGRPMTDKELDTWYTSRRKAERLIDECTQMEKDIDGSDGRPKFNSEEILKHMQETGIKTPKKAYKDKYESELDTWKSSELNKSKVHTMPTLDGGATKEPTPVKVTRDNISRLVNEELWGHGEQ